MRLHAASAQRIPKEEDILYPLADKILSPSGQKELFEKVEKVEKERITKENIMNIYI